MPNRMLGSAASRSMTVVRTRANRAGAYSLMNSAIATPNGTASTNAIVAMTSVPSSSPSTPKWPKPGFHTLVVKNDQTPVLRNAGRDLSTRKKSVAPTMTRLTEAAAVAKARKIRSPVVGWNSGVWGTSAASIVATAPSPMLMNPRRGVGRTVAGRVLPQRNLTVGGQGEQQIDDSRRAGTGAANDSPERERFPEVRATRPRPRRARSGSPRRAP